MNDHHRDWSSLPSLAINGTAKFLNAVDHVRFRTVCSEWRRHTGERQKAPLVILADLDIEDDSIRALSFFDIIGKTIIPLRPLAYQGVPDSHYLVSSRGWIFIGKYTFAQNGNQDRLRITLLNPFTEDGIINLPLLDDQPWGRVFLSGTPTNLQNDNVTVLYYIVCDDFVSAKVYFIRAGQNRWTSFLLNIRPENVVACEGHFYATFEGVLSEIDLENRRLANVEFVLPGLPDAPSLNSAFPLRFLEDLHGRLHLFFTSSYRTNSYCFLNVVLFQNGPVNMHRFEPPFHYWTERYLVISDDFSVESRHDEDYVNIDDYYPFRLLLRLSRFWNYGRNQWEPVGWITPTLLRSKVKDA